MCFCVVAQKLCMIDKVNTIDPNQFIITRKRKKYKFAKFANARNCFELDEWITESCLRPGLKQSEWGGLYIKHDNLEFFQWSLEQLVAEGWRIDELSFDLHESELSDDYKTLTSYEQRWLEEGRTTQFVRAH